MHTSWWEKNWQGPVIPSNHEHQKISLILIFALGVSLPLSAYLLFEHNKAILLYLESSKFSMLFTPLIPITIFIFCIIKIRSNINFGDDAFTMCPYPAVVGNTFSGSIHLTKRADTETFFAELILNKSIKNQRAINKGKTGDEARIKTVWKMPVTINKKNSDGVIQLYLEARLPDNAPASTPPENDEHYDWQLHIFSLNQRFQRTWSIPIIQREE
jgi:hypothetical protein